MFPRSLSSLIYLMIVCDEEFSSFMDDSVEQGLGSSLKAYCDLNFIFSFFPRL
jgi:hypothetical protein